MDELSTSSIIKTVSGNRLIIPLLLILFITIVFHNTLLNSFSYDDNVIIVFNQKNLGELGNLPTLVTKEYFSISKETTYRPLVTLSYFMDQYLWGLNPFGFHLTNLLLHLANVLLVYSLFQRLCRSDLIAIASTALYSVQPVLTEAINSVGFREDLLATMFVLLSTLLYIRGNLAISILSYGMALLSKESAFPLPFILIAYDYLYHRCTNLKKYLWYSLIAALYLYLRFFLLYNPVEDTLINKVPLLMRLSSIPVAIFYYIKLLLFPIPLISDYPSFDFLLRPAVSVYLIAAMSFAIFTGLIKIGAVNRTALFGVCWFMFTLLPVLNIVPIIYPFAERFLYLPAIGFMLFIGNLQLKGSLASVKAMLILVTVISFSVLSHHRNAIWENEEGLWRDTISKAPHSLRASLNMSALLVNKKEYDAAIAVLKKYLELAPEYPTVYNNMGNAYVGKGEYVIAIKNYEKAILLDSHYMEPRKNLAIIYKIEREPEKAMEEYRKAIEIEPDNPDLYQSMGITYAEQGLFDKAVKAFETALTKDPLSTEAHYGLGILYEEKGMNMKAFQEYQEELTINPLYSEARIAIGNLYAKNGRPREAKREFMAVLKEKPENEEARLSLHKLREMKLNKRNRDAK